MYKNFLKRIIDFTIVFIALLIIWPILLIITIWLHFANKGAGAFFTQERPGKDGKIFKVIKYKTMTDERDEKGNLLPDAQRLTKVGKFVRSTSIDELPQCNGRNAISWQKKFELDVWYVDNCTLWTDIKIIWITIMKVLKRADISQEGQATMEVFNGNN